MKTEKLNRICIFILLFFLSCYSSVALGHHCHNSSLDRLNQNGYLVFLIDAGQNTNKSISMELNNKLPALREILNFEKIALVNFSFDMEQVDVTGDHCVEEFHEFGVLLGIFKEAGNTHNEITVFTSVIPIGYLNLTDNETRQNINRINHVYSYPVKSDSWDVILDNNSNFHVLASVALGTRFQIWDLDKNSALIYFKKAKCQLEKVDQNIKKKMKPLEDYIDKRINELAVSKENCQSKMVGDIRGRATNRGNNQGE